MATLPDLQTAKGGEPAIAGALDLLLGLVESEYLARHARPAPGAAIPVIIVAGFLGSGKTTLLRHLLTASHGKRLAVVVNDYAALNIDAALVAEVTSDTVALENGCVCCSLSGSVARTLIAIAEREQSPDAIILEASGVADPANLAHVTGALPGLLLDSVVTVVDATSDLGDPAVSAFLARQVSVADIVLLNKTDLVSHDEARWQLARIRQWAPHAAALMTSHCAVPLSLLLDMSHRQAGAAPQGEVPQFESVVIPADRPFDRARFEQCLGTLPRSVLRVKGFVSFACDPDEVWLVQCVRRRWNLERHSSASRDRGLIAIAPQSSETMGQVRQHFRRWLAPAEPVS